MGHLVLLLIDNVVIEVGLNWLVGLPWAGPVAAQLLQHVLRLGSERVGASKVDRKTDNGLWIMVMFFLIYIFH